MPHRPKLHTSKSRIFVITSILIAFAAITVTANWGSGFGFSVFTADEAVSGTKEIAVDYVPDGLSASPTPTPCDPNGNYNVLIVYSDSVAPTTLQTQLLADPGVDSVTLFDAGAATPTLAQLQQYQIVVGFGQNAFLAPVTLGNNLADYIDGNGVFVGFTFLWGSSGPIQGRYATGGYSPYNIPAPNSIGVPRTLGTFTAGHPLMDGVTTLNADNTNTGTLSPGAVQVATWSGSGDPLIATQTVSGRPSVGITAYMGNLGPGTGDFARVVANAGRWLAPGPSAPTPTPTPTPSPTPSPTPTPCDPNGNYNVLIVYSDSVAPTTLQTQLLADPGVDSVTLFDAGAATPTLAQLQQYQIVVGFGQNAFLAPVTLGNNLADYIDGNGVFVGFTFLWGSSGPIQGRYATGGYSPYNIPAPNSIGVPRTLGTFTAGHPLMDGVTTLNADNTNTGTLSPGAVQVATWSGSGDPLIATQTVSGRPSVGITAYMGNLGPGTGDFARVVANAGRWLAPGPCAPTPTPTPTPSPTPSPTPTPCDPNGNYNVLIVYSDSVAPTTLQTQLLADPGVDSVTLFDAGAATPTLAQLQQYQIVVGFGQNAFLAPVTLGNNLADYIDGNGVFVGFTFLWGSSGPIQGRYATGGYSPYNIPAPNSIGVPRTLGTFTAGHPLMDGVTTLNANNTNTGTLSPGAVQVATWSGSGDPLIATQTVSGRPSVGITAYMGNNGPGTGDFARVVANAGRWLAPGPCAPTPTPTPTIPPVITGTATYGNPASATTKFISNVAVTGNGSPNVFTTTAAPGGTAGQYTLTGFGAGSYTVSLSKTTGQNGITAGDASRTAQHAAGLSIIPSAGQRIAADATGNGSITAGDAAQIARFAAGLGAGTAVTNQWRFFVPDPGFPTFPIGSSPTTRSYADPIGNPTAQDYIGILVGEVTGNWTAGPLRPAGTVVGGQLSVVGKDRGYAAKPITITAQHLAGAVDREIVVPVSVHGAADNSVIAYEFDLRYDPSVIQPSAEPVDVAGTVSRGLLFVTNALEPGLLRAVVYGPMAINEDGVLLNLKFMAIGSVGSVSAIAFERIMFNEGDQAVATIDGQIELSEKVFFNDSKL